MVIGNKNLCWTNYVSKYWGSAIKSKDAFSRRVAIFLFVNVQSQCYHPDMFTSKPKKKTVLKNFQTDVQHGYIDYPHRLNFYTVPPQSEVTLEEFELWAIDRLYGMCHPGGYPRLT